MANQTRRTTNYPKPMSFEDFWPVANAIAVSQGKTQLGFAAARAEYERYCGAHFRLTVEAIQAGG